MTFAWKNGVHEGIRNGSESFLEPENGLVKKCYELSFE